MSIEEEKDVVQAFIESRDVLYEHLGFVEDWIMYPLNFEAINDRWCLHPDGTIRWQDEKCIKTKDCYEADIVYPRFYPKGSIFEGKDYTMIFGNPYVDGMTWAYIFRNSLRVPRIEMGEIDPPEENK